MSACDKSISIDWGPVSEDWQRQVAACTHVAIKPAERNLSIIKIVKWTRAISLESIENIGCQETATRKAYILWCDSRAPAEGANKQEKSAFYRAQAELFLDATLVKGYADVIFPCVGDRPSDLAFCIDSISEQLECSATKLTWRMRGAFSGDIKDTCAEYALMPGNILILSDSGTGKEGVARLVHNLEFAKQPFVGVCLSTITDELFSSQFFGIEKGTATDVGQAEGFLEQAKGGTLFLDEIADITPRAQQSLLRVLSERSYISLGGRKRKHISCRIISATNRYDDIRNPKIFRQDLRMRLEEIRFASSDVVQYGPMRTIPQVSQELPFLFAVEIVNLLREWLGQDCRVKSMALADEAIIALMSPGVNWDGNFRALRRMARSALLEAIRATQRVDSNNVLTSMLETNTRKDILKQILKENELQVKSIKSTSQKDIARLPVPWRKIREVLLDAARKNEKIDLLTEKGMQSMRKELLLTLRNEYPEKSASKLGKMLGIPTRMAQKILQSED
ncbi:sigma 54-interacting transcriptional regulator [Desulfovibrio sp. 1188_IL3213]